MSSNIIFEFEFDPDVSRQSWYFSLGWELHWLDREKRTVCSRIRHSFGFLISENQLNFWSGPYLGSKIQISVKCARLTEPGKLNQPIIEIKYFRGDSVRISNLIIDLISILALKVKTLHLNRTILFRLEKKNVKFTGMRIFLSQILKIWFGFCFGLRSQNSKFHRGGNLLTNFYFTIC